MADRSSESIRLSEAATPVWPGRRGLFSATLLLVAGCALPRSHDLAGWARTASVTVDYPAVTTPGSDGLRAMQLVLSNYFFALGILADRGKLIWQEDAFTALLPRIAATDAGAGRAAAELDTLLREAQAGNPQAPKAMIGPNMEQLPDDERLGQTVRAADPAVQALLSALTAGVARSGAADGATQAAVYASARAGYGQLVARIGVGHRLLAQRGRHWEQEETRRLMREEDEMLQRLAGRLPSTTPVVSRAKPLIDRRG